jgi:hypothetical protein
MGHRWDCCVSGVQLIHCMIAIVDEFHSSQEPDSPVRTDSSGLSGTILVNIEGRSVPWIHVQLPPHSAGLWRHTPSTAPHRRRLPPGTLALGSRGFIYERAPQAHFVWWSISQFPGLSVWQGAAPILLGIAIHPARDGECCETLNTGLSCLQDGSARIPES